MQPNTRLQQAIDQCYAAFSDYSRPLKLHGSPLRDVAQIMRDLSAGPLRQLTGEQVGPYAGWALTTVGEVPDYKYFLPRILELTIHQPVWHGTDPLIIASRLQMADWLNWPQSESGAIRDVYQQAWAQALLHHVDEVDAMPWLEGIFVLNLDVQMALKVWLESPSAVQLAQFITFSQRELFEPRDSENENWLYDDGGSEKHLGTWIASDAVRKYLYNSINRTAEKDRWILESALITLPASNAG